MKKLIILVLICAVVASVAIYKTRTVESPMSDLLLENVEALAGDEIDDMVGHIKCIGISPVVCPLTYLKVEYVAIGYSLE